MTDRLPNSRKSNFATEPLVAERIAVATYYEIVTYFGQDDPTSRTMMEVILRTR
jgi:bacterioferritin